MAVNYSRMEIANSINPTYKKDIGRWLDQTFKAPNDATNNRMYYDGVMGSVPLQVLTHLEPLPPNTSHPNGGTFNALRCNCLTVVFKGQPYLVVLEDIELPWGVHKGIYNGRTVNAYMGYVVAGIVETTIKADSGAKMAQMLW